MLVISGKRPVRRTEGRAYQQVEIPTGSFRRAVELGVDIEADAARATFEDGLLRVELPIQAAGVDARRCRSSGPPIERGRRELIEFEGEVPGGSPIEIVTTEEIEDALASRRRAAGGAAGAAAPRHGHLPGDADAARRRPGALDQADRRRPLRRPGARHGRLQGPRARRARARRHRAGRRRRRRRADAQGPGRDDPDPRPGHRSGSGSGASSRPSPT